jgi:hypothetical protein
MKKVENSHVESSTMMNVISNPTKEDIDRREPDDSILYVSPEASLKPSGFEEESASERSVPSPNVGQVSAIEMRIWTTSLTSQVFAYLNTLTKSHR